MEASRARGSCADPPPGRVIPITVFRSKQRHPLNAIFAPRSVAVIGATEKAGSVGRTLLWNLASHPFGGPVYPATPGRPNVLGTKPTPNLPPPPHQPHPPPITS